MTAKKTTFSKKALFGLLLATPLAFSPGIAQADKGDWDDVRDARKEIRQEQRDIREAEMDLRKERRQHDWEGARDAQREIRDNQREWSLCAHCRHD